MNRKKIALLLTGLSITSSIFTGCGSSTNNNKTSNNRTRVAQEEPFLKRAAERIVTEYNEAEQSQEQKFKQPENPIAYADDKIDNSLRNKSNENLNLFPEENQFDNSQNFENSTRNEMNLNDGIAFDPTPDYQMKPSEGTLNNEQIYNFENSSLLENENQINGFSNVIEEDSIDKNEVVDNNNSGNNKGKRRVQAPVLYNNEQRAAVDEKNLVGQINVLGVKGNSEITSNKPQGVAEVSFKLSGDILKAQHSSEALSTLLQNAYEETRKDANLNYSGTGTLTEREKLQAALSAIFTPSDSEIKMIFKSNDGAVKIIPFSAANMFPDNSKSKDYVRHIVDLDASAGQSRAVKSINSSDIVIKMMVRIETPDGSELKTNTDYSFVGIEGDKNLKTTAVDTTKEQLVGFTIPNFKTGKIPSKIEAKDDSSSVIYEATSNADEGTQKTDMYLNQFTDNTYISMKKMLDATNDLVQESGTSIRFKSIILNDTDKTITKIEIEDDRNNKYPVSLVSVDSTKPESGSYLEVTGLKRDTPYLFTRLRITYKVGNDTETKVISFANFDNSKLELNNLQIRTAAFSGPQLELGADHDKKVKLPNGLEVDAVKNDNTALRYIFKVDNSEGFVGDVRVNGLRAGEESKVEKIVDKKSKINYYVVTLSKLTPNTDYSFVILEVDYKDPEGKELVGRQALGDINNSGTGLTDNRTEINALTGTQIFNVVVNESVNSKNPRNVEIPIFIDDIQGRFLRVDFTAPKENPSAKVVYEDNLLKFADLKPETSSVFKVDIVYNDADNREQKIAKYIKVVTPRLSDLDIKSSTIKPGAVDADVTFELYSQEKSPVRTVVVKNEQEKEIKSTWNKERKILKLEGLTEKTEYTNLKVIFTLENGKTVEHILDTFTTKEQEVKPTGAVADFVSRIYKIALGREPEVEGWNFWINKLQNKEITATELIAENLMTQSEFIDRELNKRNFVTTMYSLIVNREPDEEGQRYWERKYDEYRKATSSIERLRIKIAREMMDQPEFKELVSNLKLKY